MKKVKLGILLANVGTPDAPTPSAVKRYLKEFLSDTRIIEISQFLWQPILRTLILPFRSRQSACLYQKIWTKTGSPLLSYSLELANQLEVHLRKEYSDIHVVVGMRYGKPSIEFALEKLRDKEVNSILVLPLYPQYSATTTASVFDAIATTFKKWRVIPEMRFITCYAEQTDYIKAMSQRIQQHWDLFGKQYLLFSFHGIPQRYADLGDPYALQCQRTAQLIAAELNLQSSEWSVAFQSRLGPTQWLAPYTDKTLASLPKQGVKDIHVICPGFPVDCLETLEEIAIRGKEQFLKGGGNTFQYIPALNTDRIHVEMLRALVLSSIK